MKQLYSITLALAITAAMPLANAQRAAVTTHFNSMIHHNEPPQYVPTQQYSGTIRSWGHGYLKVAMKNWEVGFHKFQPNVKFDDTLVSSAAAIAGLYSGRADIGVLAREITPPEVAAYEKMTQQKLFAVDVLTGSLGNPDKIMALGIFVNKNNPLAQLTFDQLDAIFSAERRRGEKDPIRIWGQLGLTGEWANRSIQPYSGPAFEAPGYFFSQTVLNGSVLWNCDLKQVDDLPMPNAHDLDGYQRIVDAVGADRYAIGISGAGYENQNAKLIAIARPGGSFVLPSPQNVADRTYPLSRPVRFYINNGPRVPPNRIVLEFFRYILSREGQQDAQREGEFFALPNAVDLRERAHLAATPVQGPLAR